MGIGGPRQTCSCGPGGELGIALSGGGAAALTQLGVLKVLDREHIPVSYMAGTSAGAVIGAVYVTSESAQQAEQRILDHLASRGTGFNLETFNRLASPRGTTPGGLLGRVGAVWRASRRGEALLGGQAMHDSLRLLLGQATFANARVPFATTALDLVTGRRVIFAGGPLADAAYASSAIPGLFEPFRLDDHVLVDGGWAEPVPVDTCHHLGAIHIVAVDIAAPQSHRPVRGAVSTALLADALARELLQAAQLQAADFVVRPQGSVQDFGDFTDPGGLITAGERAAETELPAIAAVLERHRALFVRARSGPVMTGATAPGPRMA